MREQVSCEFLNQYRKCFFNIVRGFIEKNDFIYVGDLTQK